MLRSHHILIPFATRVGGGGINFGIICDNEDIRVGSQVTSEIYKGSCIRSFSYLEYTPYQDWTQGTCLCMVSVHTYAFAIELLFKVAWTFSRFPFRMLFLLEAMIRPVLIHPCCSAYVILSSLRSQPKPPFLLPPKHHSNLS